MQLRPYQVDCVEAGLSYFEGSSKKPSVIVAPTGAGKTVIIAELIKRRNKPAIVLQPSKELLAQNYSKLLSFGYDAVIFSASFNSKEISKTIYATLGSIIGHAEELKATGMDFDIYVDECHYKYPPPKKKKKPGEEESQFIQFMNILKPKKVLGFTASPYYLRQHSDVTGKVYSQLDMMNRVHPKFFKDIIHVVQIQDISKQFWTPLVYQSWDFDGTGLVLNSTGSEFTEESIREVISKNGVTRNGKSIGVNNNIFLEIQEILSTRKKILVFMDSVESCETITKFFNNKHGYEIAATVSGETASQKRTEAINSFNNGDLRIVFNHSTLVVGFDSPKIDCVILGRPTFSMAVYYQILGRGVRLHPDKKDCLIVDCCNNFQRFGRVEDMTIEDLDGYGWGVFSGNRLITGIPFGEIRYKEDAHRKIKPKFGDPVLGQEIIWFGEHKDKKLCQIPHYYLKFLVEKVLKDEGRNSVIFKYYKSL